MKTLLNRIDGYLDIQEKKDSISRSLKSTNDIGDIIEMIKESGDVDGVLSSLDDDMREKIEKLIEGGIL